MGWEYIVRFILEEDSVENTLNEYGRNGWEAITIQERLGGFRVYFKRPINGTC